MSITGQKIASLVGKSSDVEKRDGIGLDAILETLQRRPLGCKHLDQAYTCLQRKMEFARPLAVRESVTDNKNTVVRLHDRAVIASALHLAVAKNDYRFYTPVSILHSFTSDCAKILVRCLPVKISYGHIDQRARQRTGETMQYATREMADSIELALSLARSCEDFSIRNGRQRMSILVPHAQGLFVGKMERVQSPGFYDFQTESSILVSHSQGICTNLAGAEWQPNFEMHLSTFIDPGLFTSAQHALYQKFQEILRDTGVKRGLMEAMLAYGVGNCSQFGRFRMDLIEKAWSRLDEIVRSPLWAQAGNRQGERLPIPNGP